MDLEDFHNDIIVKAQRGLSLSNSALCEKADISPQALQEAKSNAFDEATLRKIAVPLKLNPDALVASARKSWKPQKIEIAGLKQFPSQYTPEGGLVNAYLIWDPQTNEGIIADTGMDATDLINTLTKLKITPKYLLLTHSHGDHIAELQKIQKSFPNLKTLISKEELIPHTEPIEPGAQLQVGKLTISTRNTSGHSPGGLTYLIQGLAKPIAVVGDALFAGSMGGASPSTYQDALTHNQQEILSLPQETILCPGHGPMTTVAEEKEHNPFFS